MATDLSTTFTGIRFQNPFLLSSAPPTESESNILRAFEAGWGGVVTKTIGLHPVVNVAGPKTKFLRADADSPHLSMKKRPGAALHSSWNWELISDKTLDWWVPRLGRIKKAFPQRVLVASIMAGSGNDTELKHWQDLAKGSEFSFLIFATADQCPQVQTGDVIVVHSKYRTWRWTVVRQPVQEGHRRWLMSRYQEHLLGLQTSL